MLQPSPRTICHVKLPIGVVFDIIPIHGTVHNPQLAPRIGTQRIHVPTFPIPNTLGFVARFLKRRRVAWATFGIPTALHRCGLAIFPNRGMIVPIRTDTEILIQPIVTSVSILVQ
jgi:hypothetical protein